MTSYAPGSAKLFGEHAVVYDRIGVSAAADLFASCSILPSSSHRVEFSFPDFGYHFSYSEEEIENSVRLVEAAQNVNALFKQDFALPFAYLVGKAFEKKGFETFRVSLSSKIPRASGLGSSSALFAALAAEVNVKLELGLSPAGLVEWTNLGDKIVHGRPSGLDGATVVCGGFLKFRKSTGFENLKIKPISVLVVNSNVQKDTGGMIAKVAQMYKRDKPGVNEIFDEIQEAAFAGLDALASGDMHSLGAEFDRAQGDFVKLGLSVRETDEIVALAKKQKAYGAKISGAGGGGVALVLAKEPSKLIPAFEKAGYPSFVVKLGVEGVRSEAIEVEA